MIKKHKQKKPVSLRINDYDSKLLAEVGVFVERVLQHASLGEQYKH